MKFNYNELKKIENELLNINNFMKIKIFNEIFNYENEKNLNETEKIKRYEFNIKNININEMKFIKKIYNL